MKCNKCQIDKIEEEFSFRYKSKGIRQKVCKECSRENNKDHYNNNKSYYSNRNRKSDKEARDYIKDIKSKSCCKLCSENHPACLHFHHRDPQTKNFVIATGPSFGLNALKREIEKCDILCANCHAKLHYNK